MYSGSVEVPSDDLEDFVSSGMNLQIKGIQSAELELDHVDNTSESSFNNEVIIYLFISTCGVCHMADSNPRALVPRTLVRLSSACSLSIN